MEYHEYRISELIPLCGGSVEIAEMNPGYRCFAVRGTKLVYWNDDDGKIRFEYREIPEYDY